jgi:hypothetical protein
MKIKVQLVVCAEDGREEQVQEIAMVEKPHQLDSFHLAMRLTVLQQTVKGLPQTISVEDETYRLRDAVVQELGRLNKSSANASARSSRCNGRSVVCICCYRPG